MTFFIVLVSRVVGFRFFEAEERKHAIVFITHTLGRKGVSINTIGRYCRVLSQFRMFLLRYNYFYCFRRLSSSQSYMKRLFLHGAYLL